MACNFFSLGSGNGNCSNRETNPLPENLNNNNNNNLWNSSILYRNEEMYQKGLIWQQYVQFHHHNDTLMGPTSRGGMNCQDCGNQAKKDCSHLRCRACCNGRGLDCATHVRSTWVPAAKRRERQQQRQQSDDHQTTQQKRQRDNNINYLGGSGCTTTTTITSAPRLARASTSKGLELGQHFPAEITSPAVFRCVRVHSIDDADEQLAYQTAVNIGGRFFKGILYDQGPENRYTPIPPGGGGGAETANLMNDNATTTITTKQPEAALLDPNTMYSPPISAFLACTQFFQTPRS